MLAYKSYQLNKELCVPRDTPYIVFSVSIQKLSGKSCFIVYEFWEINAWNSHLQMNYSKSFQRSNVDCLETPEHITTMLVPGN
ncbi:hypothetical protein Chor_002761, partial [Crotalus horridus]